MSSEDEMDVKPQQRALSIGIDRSKVPKAANFVEIYANDTFIQLTPWDVRLMFGVIGELGEDQNKPTPIRVADVRMSLQHAKKVTQLLTAQIELYERENGELALPKSTPK